MPLTAAVCHLIHLTRQEFPPHLDSKWNPVKTEVPHTQMLHNYIVSGTARNLQHDNIRLHANINKSCLTDGRGDTPVWTQEGRTAASPPGNKPSVCLIKVVNLIFWI
jgi:hypothetical protein